MKKLIYILEHEFIIVLSFNMSGTLITPEISRAEQREIIITLCERNESVFNCQLPNSWMRKLHWYFLVLVPFPLWLLISNVKKNTFMNQESASFPQRHHSATSIQERLQEEPLFQLWSMPFIFSFITKAHTFK